MTCRMTGYAGLDKGLDNCLNNIDVARAGKHMVRAEGFFVNIFKLTHATGDQNGFKPSLEARQNIGAHIIAYDDSIFRVAINMIKR